MECGDTVAALWVRGLRDARRSVALEHAGVAIRLITPELVADTLAQYEIILTEAGCDTIARDVAAD